MAESSSGSNGWAQVKRERSWENPCCKRYSLIQVNCNMNAKDQTQYKNIWIE